MPGSDGQIEDVLLGYDNAIEYLEGQGPNLGSSVGLNMFCPDAGFQTRNWTSALIKGGVVFTIHTQGKDGDVVSTISYKLSPDSGQLFVEMSGMGTKPISMNMATNMYINLGGHRSGSRQLRDHKVQINMDHYIDQSGKKRMVANTPWDFRGNNHLGKALVRQQQWVWNEKNQILEKDDDSDLLKVEVERFSDVNMDSSGFDITYHSKLEEESQMKMLARIEHPQTKRFLEVKTTSPTLRFHTG